MCRSDIWLLPRGRTKQWAGLAASGGPGKRLSPVLPASRGAQFRGSFHHLQNHPDAPPLSGWLIGIYSPCTFLSPARSQVLESRTWTSLGTITLLTDPGFLRRLHAPSLILWVFLAKICRCPVSPQTLVCATGAPASTPYEHVRWGTGTGFQTTTPLCGPQRPCAGGGRGGHGDQTTLCPPGSTPSSLTSRRDSSSRWWKVAVVSQPALGDGCLTLLPPWVCWTLASSLARTPGREWTLTQYCWVNGRVMNAWTESMNTVSTIQVRVVKGR